MATPSFTSVLEATGYLSPDGEAADGLHTRGMEAPPRVRHVLDARSSLPIDAVFTAHGAPMSMFIDAGDRELDQEELRNWHEKAWNVGLAPLLWIVTPVEVHLFNCYEKRDHDDSSDGTHIHRVTISNLDELADLRKSAGRFATETGAFWTGKIGKQIDRRNRVDQQLLAEIEEVEDRLAKLTAYGVLGHYPEDITKISSDLREYSIGYAQKLIARTILAWYVVDRRLADPILPDVLRHGLPLAFLNASTGLSLFDWMQGTFNGDLYPIEDLSHDRMRFTSSHADVLRSFTNSEVVKWGQGRLFKFRFESIPIDLISSVYQQFTRTLAGAEAKRQSLHYTSVELADMVLDPVFEGLSPRARIIDPTCGSGIFLVEAFRRLVWKRCGDTAPPRRVVREVLYGSLHGIDINPAALRVAAFSLVLAALELDGEPVKRREDLQFHHLIGSNLHQIDLLKTSGAELRSRLGDFDAVVGNPPWTFVSGSSPAKSSPATPESVQVSASYAAAVEAAYHDIDDETATPRRSPDHDFVRQAVGLIKPQGRVGLILKATPFFTIDTYAEHARRDLLQLLAPVAIVNLSQLRLEKLFPNARGAALLLFGRCPLTPNDDNVLIGSAPWSASFRRSGVVEIGPADFRRIPISSIEKRPKLLKAASVGSFRDVQLIDRLERELPTLSEVLDAIGIRAGERRGQGLILGRPPSWSDYEADEKIRAKNPKLRKVPAWLRQLPFYGPEDYKKKYRPFRIPNQSLSTYSLPHPERIRTEGIFEGPLLLCPKGQLKSGIIGRYSAALVPKSIAYTQNFYGISFHEADAKLATVMSGFLNSALASYQLAFGSGAVGIERPAVSPQDVLSLRMPFVRDWQANARLAVSEREAAAANDPSKSNLALLDEAIADLFDLDFEERTIVGESLERNRWMFVDSREEFTKVTRRPAVQDYRKYASAVIRSVDAYLEGEERFLCAEIVTTGGADQQNSTMAAIRFRINSERSGEIPVLHDKADEEIILDYLHDSTDSMHRLPYLNERRVLRVYANDELLICKPAEWRHWTETAGLNDADTILSDHRMSGF